MNEENKNMDSFLDNKIKNSLLFQTSDEFSDELLKRINLENEFAIEDKKTMKIARFITGGVITFMVFIVLVLGIVLKTNENGKEISYLYITLDKFSGFIEFISMKTIDNLGFSVTPQSLIVFLLALVFILIFSFADKMIFRKS